MVRCGKGGVMVRTDITPSLNPNPFREEAAMTTEKGGGASWKTEIKDSCLKQLF